MSKSNPAQPVGPVLELKAGAQPLLSLRLSTTDPALIDPALAEKVAQAPKFFEQAGVVLELPADSAQLGADAFDRILNSVRGAGLLPAGVHANCDSARDWARHAGLALVHGSARQPAAAAPKPRALKIIDRPVRSGQQVHAAGADLVVLAAVSAGAEILADGHIYVYGVLRGRALAGLDGDRGARIICQRLQAELVSIAGQYRVLERIDPDLREQMVQVYLDNDSLRIVAGGTSVPVGSSAPAAID